MDAIRKAVAPAPVAAPRHREHGFEAAGLHEPHPWMDPWLAVDHFVMSERIIRPHPHAGFSAITVMFEDSPGSFVNRDSLGTVVPIEPGDVHWTQAGSGIIHEEAPSRPPTPCHGAQIFIDLPADREEAPPEVHHLEASEVPVVPLDGGGRVRVLGGALGEAVSPLRPATDVTMLDVDLPPGGTALLPVPAHHTAFVLALGGDGRVGPPDHEVGLPPDHAAGLDDGDVVRVVAGDRGLHALVGGGRPLRQPAHWRGGLAMSSPARVAAAAQRYQNGELGRLDASF